MFNKKHEQADATSQTVEGPVLRKAEDGAEMLFALARFFEFKGDKAYTEQIRNAAHAVREIVEQHPNADLGDPDSVFGANEHANKIRVLLNL